MQPLRLVATSTASVYMNAVTVTLQLRRCWRLVSSVSHNRWRGLTTTVPAECCANLRAHVATMVPLGYNAHALGVLAARHPYLILGSPEASAAQFAMPREVFQPWSDELAQDLSRTVITQECLPALAKDADLPTATALAAASKRGLCSLVHKAMLAGPSHVLE